MKIADFGLSRTFRLPDRSYTDEVVTMWYRAPEVILGCPDYSAAIDVRCGVGAGPRPRLTKCRPPPLGQVWSIGCIVGEMFTGEALVQGDSEIDSLFKMFQLLGTPVPEEAPTLCALPRFQAEFPRWPKRSLAEVLPSQTDPLAIDLLAVRRACSRRGRVVGCSSCARLSAPAQRLLTYEPKLRVSAKRAQEHPYFLDAHEAAPVHPAAGAALPDDIAHTAAGAIPPRVQRSSLPAYVGRSLAKDDIFRSHEVLTAGDMSVVQATRAGSTGLMPASASASSHRDLGREPRPLAGVPNQTPVGGSAACTATMHAPAHMPTDLLAFRT